MTQPLVPLQKSWAVGKLEEELKALFIELYDENIRPLTDDINCYGMPHLGSFSLVERNFTQDGLAVLRQNDINAMRYLFKAWRGRNPRRGLHFLRTYLQALFGSVFTVEQMWQKKSEEYPTYLRSATEASWGSNNIEDYFLTSRIRADINTDLVLPERVLKALHSTVAARFVLQIRIARSSITTLSMATITRPQSVGFISGTPMPVNRPKYSEMTQRLATIFRPQGVIHMRTMAARYFYTPERMIYLNDHALIV